MSGDCSSDLQNFWQRSCKGFLVICWFLGLLVGIVIACGADDSYFLTMLSDEFTVSITGLLMVVVLPFLFTAVAVFLSNRFMLLTVVFLKAFSFGYIGFGIMSVYSSASWLVRFLLMFSDICSLPLLMWLWIRCTDQLDHFPKAELLVCLAVSLAFGILDVWIVSPFSAMLL